MKRSIVTSLTTAMLIGAASTTFAAANPFSDVPSDHWAYDAVTTLAKDGVAKLGTAAKRINDQSNFVANLADSLKAGVGALVDADMEEASARLQALQTQQQLGVQALSIANQAPQTILSLFK